jgi:hypothetical protein
MFLVVLSSIQALLSAPNPDDPLAENVAKHWKTNEVEAVETGEYMLFQINVVNLFSPEIMFVWKHFSTFYAAGCFSFIHLCAVE